MHGMTPESAGERDLLLRELAYWRQEYNDLGASLARMQEAQSRAAREALRKGMIAELISAAYRIASQDVPAEAIGAPILATITDKFFDRGAFLQESPAGSGNFVVEHALGLPAGTKFSLDATPGFLFTASNRVIDTPGQILTGVIGMPFLLWAYDSGSGRALLLGNQKESNIHRPFEPRDEELVGSALTVYVDILLRKLAEATLRQAKAAAEEANDVRARFLAILSHELRTPLNAVIGFSELLLQTGQRAPTPPQQEEYSRQILDAGRSMLSLVKDILDFSSFNNAKPRLRLDWVPVGQLLHNAVRAFAAETAQRAINIALTLPDPSLKLPIDYDRLRQILANLIGNAIKFTPNGGKIEIFCLDGGTITSIVVRDSGVGMRPEDIPRAMEPFVQLENMRRHSLPGTGLGLPIAKQLIESHGGALMIESIYGHGTTVTIALPNTPPDHLAETLGT
jgi:signal transduction histidine kinase